MPRKILLADDSVTAQNMGRRILSEAGYEVVTVNNGSAALKKLAELSPDLVILDIYMPGYGGIEVCQRIKENLETSNIPVLLTVGKLEPFKAEEARRVRADAHLVKPFEATELLAALTKLEDKMVPRPAAGPVGKSAKSKASDAVTSPVKDKKFADTDSGWKQRLTIPTPEARRQEPEEIETPSTAFREFVHPETQEATPAPPSAVAGHDQLNREITAEEIAAITAAAAAFGNHTSPSEADPSRIAVTEEEIVAAVSPVPAPVEAAPEPIVEPEPEAIPSPEVAFSADSAAAEEPAAEAVAASPEAASPEEVVESPVVAVTSPEADIITAEAEADLAPEPVAPELATDAEVAAALASLAPVNDRDSSVYAAGNGEAFGAKVGVFEEAFAHVGSGWQSYADGRARWMAEEIAVPQSEASLILEQEMQKAYAALADSGNAVTSSVAEADFAPEYASAASAYESAVPDSESRVEEIPSSSVEEPIASAIVIQETEQLAPEPLASEQDYSAATPEMVAPLEAVEQAQEVLAQESEPAEAVAMAAMAEPGETKVAAQPMETAEPVAMAAETVKANTSYEESAYAAAASVGTKFHSITYVEAASAPEAPPEYVEKESPAVPAEADHEHEAELAAAWAHWRQIRESVANPQFTSQVADAAAVGYKEIHQPESAAARSPDISSPDESSADLSADSSAIASIVDSVLAELRPKLVAEIARKLGKEKK